jgi:hypothetical protein
MDKSQDGKMRRLARRAVIACAGTNNETEAEAALFHQASTKLSKNERNRRCYDYPYSRAKLVPFPLIHPEIWRLYHKITAPKDQLSLSLFLF